MATGVHCVNAVSLSIQKPAAKAQTAGAQFIAAAIHPLSLARACWKHKLLIFTVGVLVTAGGIAIVRRLPPVYEAEALVLVDPQKVPEKFVESTVADDVQEQLATLSEEVQSTTRLNQIIDEFHLYPAARKTHVRDEVIAMMRHDIEITLEKGLGGNRPGAFRISYQGPDPVIVAKVVNRITELYVKENLRNRATRAEGTSEFIEKELQDAKRELDEQEKAVSTYKIQHNGELPQQENSLLAMMTNVQMRLQGNEDALNRAQQNKVVLENALNTAKGDEAAAERALAAARAPRKRSVEPNLNVPGHPKKRSEVLETELAAARLRYSDEHPDVRRLVAELAAALQQESFEDQAAAKRAKPANVKTSVPTPQDPPELRREWAAAHERVQTLTSQLKVTVEEIRTRTADRENTLAQIAGQQRRIEQMPIREQQMAALTRDYEISKANYRSLLDKKIAADMSSDLEKREKAERFRVLDRAHVPEKPKKPKYMVLYAMSVCVGLAGGLASAIAREMASGVILGEWEMPGDIPVLSRVPIITTPAKANPELFAKSILC